MAWVVLAPEPIDFYTLVVTYILGTWIIRLVIAAFETPFMYLARHCVRPEERVPAQPAAS